MPLNEPKYHEILLRLAGAGVQIKRRAGRAKDLAGIPYIEATIAELARQK